MAEIVAQLVLLRAGSCRLWMVDTGRFIFSLNYDEADFAAVAISVFVAAAMAMQRDGWWWEAPGVTDKAIWRGILRENSSRIGWGLRRKMGSGWRSPVTVHRQKVPKLKSDG